MKKIICCILVFIGLTFGLTGCGDEEESINYGDIIQTELDKITISSIVTEDLNFKESSTSGKYTVLFSYNTNNTDVISNTGIVTRQDSDVNVIIVATGSIEGQKVVKKKNFNVTVKKKEFIPEVLEVGNVEENRSLKSSLSSALNEYSTALNNSNYLSASTKMVVNGEESKSFARAIQSPIYLETYTNPLKDRKIVSEEDGKIFSYELKENNYVERKYRCNAEDFSTTDSDEMLDIESIFSYDFDPTKSSFKQEDNSFIIRAYFKDALSKEERDAIALMYHELGISTTALYNSIMTMTYTITKDVIEFNYKMIAYLEAGGIAIPIDMEMETSIDLSSFEPYTYDESIYTISAPSCIEEIRGVTDILNDGFYYTKYTEYIKVDLKSGQYSMSKVSGPFIFEITNEAGNSIPVGVTSSYISEKQNRTFVIPEDGIYYFKFDCGYVMNEKIYFSKCDYETIYDLDNELVLGSTSGSIEGEFDFDVFNYTSEDRKLFKITNTGTTNLYLLCVKYLGDSYRYYSVEAGKEIYIGIYEEDNRFFVGAGEDLAEYSYSFTCELVDQSSGQEENYEDYIEITPQESSQVIISGYLQAEKHLKLIVENRGIYTINHPSQPLVYEKETGVAISYYAGNYKNFMLEKGEYIVKLYTNDHILTMAPISYTYHSVEDKDVEVVLPVSGTTTANIISEKYLKTQKVNYKFTLEDTAIVMHRTNTDIFNSEDIKLNLDTQTNAFYEYIKLSAGSYYFQSEAMAGETIYIYITNQDNVNYLDYSNLENIPFNENVALPYGEGNRYFTFTLEKPSNIVIVLPIGGHAYLVNSNGLSITHNYSGEYSLGFGTYYLVVEFTSFSDTVVRIEI